MTPFWFASQLIAHKMRNLRLPSFLYHPNIPISLPIIALKPDKLFQYTNPCKLLSSSKTRTDFPMGHNFLLLVTTKCMKPRQHVNCLNISISYQKECTRDTRFIFIMILIYLFHCVYTSASMCGILHEIKNYRFLLSFLSFHRNFVRKSD